jgi:predicted PurR-regulated permease PerM
MLTSVLGGISTFGPIGFIIGPVIVTLFTVLLEVYNQYLAKEKKRG